MRPIIAGIKKKSAIDAVRRVTRQTSVAVNVKRVFKTATSLETHIAWRHQKRQRKNAKNTRCFT